MTAPPARILVVDDTPANVKLLVDLLTAKGYQPIAASSGEEALVRIGVQPPDLVLLDIMMPGLSGYDVCRRIRATEATALLPVVLCTSLDPKQERINGIEAGADDFIPKPINQQELFARVKSLLRIKALQDEVKAQAAQLAEWNLKLEDRVREQLAQMERLSRLKNFFSPALAEAIVSGGADDPLRSHRREITVAFLDLRGFTAFTETADPEEVMQVLREFHAAMGELILAHEGTIERFTGDGIMVFFNDPVAVDDPAPRAARMALQMQQRTEVLAQGWKKRGYDLKLGIGIAMGFATIGAIGFEGRIDYGAIGNVTNLAARLCGEAAGGEILVAPRVAAALEGSALVIEPAGEFTLKGLARPIAVSRVTAQR
jgi:class 3 adenylate cyclase/CheY-like chemotaxis protein